MENFSNGTLTIAKRIAQETEKGAVTIIGGGDSIAAVKKAGLVEKITHVSTGGGATPTTPLPRVLRLSLPLRSNNLRR